MTVAELIEQLKTQPQDAKVVHHELGEYGYWADFEITKTSPGLGNTVRLEVD